MSSHAQHPPWFKEPYVWLVIGFPLAAVIAGIITIYIAIETEDGLVVDDYYKQGLEINRTLDRDNLAKKHNIKATVLNLATTENIVVQLYSNDNFVLPEELKINLLHSTRKGYDRIFNARKTGENRYPLPVNRLQPGRWYVLTETADWRVIETIRVNR